MNLPPPRLDSDLHRLKTCWKLLVRDLGGIDAVAAATRTTRSLASEYGNINNPDRFAPVDVVLDAERIAGRPRVTETLAVLQGFALVSIEPREAGDLAAKLAEFGRDSSTLFADAAIALAHGNPTDAERAALQRDLAEIQRVVAEAVQLLAAADRRVPRAVP